jgi:hypothetical protein
MKTRSIVFSAVFLSLIFLSAGCSEKADSRATAAANPPMLIEPRAAVGQIRGDMTLEKVLATLGEPQRRTANALEYTRLGLAVMPGPDKLVQVVMCGDVTGSAGPLAKAFNGKTKEGIGMFSTKEDIIKAYGEPSEARRMIGGSESLTYATLGITFTLENDKVHHMIVRLAPPAEPDRSVTLEPAPTNKP